jgi:hypothetical protein
MIDAAYLKAHRAASSLQVKKGALDPSSVAPKSGVNTKLHAVTNAEGSPLSCFMTAGQGGNYTGAAVLLDDLPKAQCMPGSRIYDADQ